MKINNKLDPRSRSGNNSRPFWVGPLASIAVALVLIGCANMQTVGRKTYLSGETVTRHYDEQRNETGSTSKTAIGVAIHLDAQQRAIIQAGARYCAEPSPDAMAAYAASLGLGGTLSDSEIASASTALSSAVANIGLRTQSIQLMRDALYRLCEAVNNDQITKSDMAMLLRRSQDLTAVVVAVEQLTGAVVAQQAVLSAGSQATALASLVANQQILSEMEDQVAQRKQAVEATTLAVSAATTDRYDAAAAKKQADDALAQEDNDENRKVAQEKQITLENKQRVLDNRQQDLESQQQRLKDSEKVRDQIKASRDASLASSSANTTSTGQFGARFQQGNLSDSASVKIAEVVDSMVREVLQKDYTVDHCMTMLASATEHNAIAVQVCRDIMQKSATAALGTFFGVDWASSTLNCLIKEKKITREKINQWLKDKDLNSDLDDVQLVLGEESDVRALRYQYIGELQTGIKACGLK